MFNLIPSWFGLRRSNKRSKQQVQTAVDGGFRRLRHEQLEDRRMLAVLTVNANTDGPVVDDGSLLLREAIAYVNSTAQAGPLDLANIDLTEPFGTNDKIIFDPSLTGSTITLTQGELRINKSVVISGGIQNTSGGGLPNITIDANSLSRVFNVSLTASGTEQKKVELNSLAITGGVYALAA